MPLMSRTVARVYLFFFFFNDTATTEIYTLSLHDALPIYFRRGDLALIIDVRLDENRAVRARLHHRRRRHAELAGRILLLDRKSTRLNSSHLVISYAVFCLKKKKILLAALTRHH